MPTTPKQIKTIFRYNSKAFIVFSSFLFFSDLFNASAIVVKIKALKPKLEKTIPDINPL